MVASLAVASGNLDLAQEVAAEAFARAFERWKRVGAMASPGGWTYRVGLNLLRRRARRLALERRVLGRVATPSSTVPAHAVEVWEAVAHLPPRARTALALRYLGGLPEAEVAKAMGIRPGTVAATLHDARRRLAASLADGLRTEEVTRG